MRATADRAAAGTLMLVVLAMFIQSTKLSTVLAISQESNDIVDQVYSLVPTSRKMVDSAITALSNGWAAMSPAEQALFNDLFDPGNSGDIDEEYVADVLENYRKIQRRLDNPLTVVYKSDSKYCEGQRLYYTDMAKIITCPYFTLEESSTRRARVLIHESAHMALLVVDRPYYHRDTSSTRYAALTPRGSWTTGIPLLGPIIRELSHSDTLYHPDAYAWFAIELSNL